MPKPYEQQKGLKVRVLVVDDHDLVRAGFRSLLHEMPGIEVIGEARNGREALELIETNQPDVVLMDLMMPQMNGLDTTARVASKFPKVRVIILSMNTSEEYVLQALRAGAAGYLVKNIGPAELQQAIQAVVQGEAYFTPSIARHVLTGYLKRDLAQPTSLDQLTPRQREVLQLVAEGNTTKLIAKKLGISVKTAEAHRSDLMKATGIHDIAGLVRYAVREGVITPET